MMLPAQLHHFRAVRVGVALLLTAVFFLVTLLLPSLAAAQSLTYPSTPSQQAYYPQHTATEVPRTQHTLVQSLFIEIMAAGVCILAGVDVINPEQGCLGINPSSGKLAFSPPQQGEEQPLMGGLVGGMTGMMATLYTPPASAATYTSYLAQNFGINKSYAQPAQALPVENTGFSSLSGILGLYTFSRNTVYLIMVLVFVILGVGIMLRVKIDPRTVMSIQNQIPKLVVALLLVTFSYAIVGVLVDMMWVSTYVGINVLTAGDVSCENREAFKLNPVSDAKPLPYVATVNVMNNPYAYVRDIFSDAGCFGALDGVSGLSIDVGKTIGDIVSRTILAVMGIDEGKVGVSCKWYNPFDCVTETLKFGVFEFLKYLIGLIAFLIVLIAIFVSLFRLWFTLLKAYLYILLDVITGPFYIILGLLPGSTLGFQRWLRHVVAHLLLFPAAVALFLIARILASSYPANNAEATGTNAFVPPLIGNPNIHDNIGNLLAFGMILIAPEILNMLRDALKSPPSKSAGGAIGAGIGAGAGAVIGSSRQTVDRVSHRNEASPVYDATAPGNMKYKRKGAVRIFGKPIG